MQAHAPLLPAHVAGAPALAQRSPTNLDALARLGHAHVEGTPSASTAAAMPTDMPTVESHGAAIRRRRARHRALHLSCCPFEKPLVRGTVVGFRRVRRRPDPRQGRDLRDLLPKPVEIEVEKKLTRLGLEASSDRIDDDSVVLATQTQATQRRASIGHQTSKCVEAAAHALQRKPLVQK